VQGGTRVLSKCWNGGCPNGAVRTPTSQVTAASVVSISPIGQPYLKEEVSSKDRSGSTGHLTVYSPATGALNPQVLDTRI